MLLAEQVVSRLESSNPRNLTPRAVQIFLNRVGLCRSAESHVISWHLQNMAQVLVDGRVVGRLERSNPRNLTPLAVQVFLK